MFFIAHKHGIERKIAEQLSGTKKSSKLEQK